MACSPDACDGWQTPSRSHQGSLNVPAGGVETGPPAVLTVDVEDWYHLLDSPAAPQMEQWEQLESRIDRGLNGLLDLLAAAGSRATLFWLGWLAERHRTLVHCCEQAGHEIANHGYGHLLAYQAGPERFRRDVVRGKEVLEQICGHPVRGFRAGGFSVTGQTPWAFDIIRECGHDYDVSVFPAARGHGGLGGAPLGPHWIDTPSGPLLEFPLSVVDRCGCRFCLFGGGYLRLAPRWLIRLGVDHLRARGRPLIVYVHPREIDPGQPRLPLTGKRRFMYYVNLRTTRPKLEWLCRRHGFQTVSEVASQMGHPPLGGEGQ